MTISSTTRKAGPFVGDGANTSFPFAFKVFAKTDLRVVFTSAAGAESDLVLDSDYSVTLNADQDASPGGTITYPISGSPLAATEKLTALGALDTTQPTDITNLGGFYPQVIEDALDRLTMLAQQNAEAIERSVKVSVSSTSTPDDLLDDLNAAVTSAEAAQGGAEAAQAGAEAAQAGAEAAQAGAEAAQAGAATSASNAATSEANAAAAAAAAVAAAVPAGTIMVFPTAAVPTGYIKANGVLLSRTTYADLWAFAQASGNLSASDGAWVAGKFSPGDGATTFRVPDLRGEFVRGWDDGRGVDSGRGIGTYQADELKSHTHTSRVAGSNSQGAGPYPERYTNDGVTGATGGAETRPRNIAMLYCIKY